MIGWLPKDVTRGKEAHRAEERQWEVGSGVPGICPSVNPEQRRKSRIYPGNTKVEEWRWVMRVVM